MIRPHVLAFTLGLAALSAFALGGCAVQTASGDPTSQTEDGRTDPADAPAQPGSAEGATTPAESTSLNPLHPAIPTGKKPQTESSADEVKAQTSSGCAGSNTCNGAASDGTQPLPWVTQN